MIALLQLIPMEFLIGAVVAVIGFFGIRAGGVRKERQRSNLALQKAKELDYEHAETIHRAVKLDLADSLRKYEDAGYRD